MALTLNWLIPTYSSRLWLDWRQHPCFIWAECIKLCLLLRACILRLSTGWEKGSVLIPPSVSRTTKAALNNYREENPKTHNYYKRAKHNSGGQCSLLWEYEAVITYPHERYLWSWSWRLSLPTGEKLWEICANAWSEKEHGYFGNGGGAVAGNESGKEWQGQTEEF